MANVIVNKNQIFGSIFEMCEKLNLHISVQSQHIFRVNGSRNVVFSLTCIILRKLIELIFVGKKRLIYRE